MRSVFSIVLLLPLFLKAQTLVIAKAEKKRIILAADTRKLHDSILTIDGNPVKIRVVDTFRKIGTRNGISFGLMGSFLQNDIVEMPLKYCEPNISVTQAARNYGNAIDTFMLTNFKN